MRCGTIGSCQSAATSEVVVLLVTSLTLVSGAIASVQTFTFTFSSQTAGCFQSHGVPTITKFKSTNKTSQSVTCLITSSSRVRMITTNSPTRVDFLDASSPTMHSSDVDLIKPLLACVRSISPAHCVSKQE